MSLPGYVNLMLRMEGLSSVDVVTIKVFLRFVGASGGYKWALTEAADANLTMRPAAGWGDDTQPMSLEGGQTAWLVSSEAEARRVSGLSLMRPLQMEAFAAVLRGVESGLGAVPAAKSTAVKPAEPIEKSEDSRPVVKLLKWPPGDVLKSNPKFIRMLGFVQHRHLSVDQLVVLGGVDKESCIQMLSRLEEMGFVEMAWASGVDEKSEPKAFQRAGPQPIAPNNMIHAPANLPRSNSLISGGGAPVMANGVEFSEGFFGRFRKRLGLA